MVREPARRRRSAPHGLVLLLAAWALAACGSDDEIAEGGECQPCREKAPKCDAGMTCERFEGNFTYYLCAKPSTQKCSVPF